jgi:hypothetical protein
LTRPFLSHNVDVGTVSTFQQIPKTNCYGLTLPFPPSPSMFELTVTDRPAIAVLYTENGQLLPHGSGEVEGAEVQDDPMIRKPMMADLSRNYNI